jgi:RNA methyltransferase, TrmH family
VSESLAISSSANPRLKLVRRLASRNGRQREGAFVAEGEDLLAAAAAAGSRPRFVLLAPDVELPVSVREQLGRTPMFEVEPSLLAEVSLLGHPSRALAVFDTPDEQPLDGDGAIVWLDGVKDPGNVGTVLRSAAAYGAAGLVLARGSADPYSPKAVRASMGAVFQVPAVPDRRDGTARSFASTRTVVAFDAAGDCDIWDVDMGSGPVLCIGSERTGLSDVVRETATVVCRIPQQSTVDSLNAAMVATTALYEWRRQLHARQS